MNGIQKYNISKDTNDALVLGKVISESNYFADARQEAQAVVKVLAGRELGFGAIASMNGINIIKGRVSLSANIIAAAIKRSGKYDYKVVELTRDICKLQLTENGKDIGVSEFTMADAKTAGLTSGTNWIKYPRNMLFSRAISNGARWYCPDVFNGSVYTPDELGAPVNGETGAIEGDYVVVDTDTDKAVVTYVKELDAQNVVLPTIMKNLKEAIKKGDIEYDGDVTMGKVASWVKE